MGKLSIKDLDLKQKRALIRVDFNVPLKPDHSIDDDTRIKQSLPTIAYALKQGATVILMSHLGRPDGKINLNYTLKPCAKRLSEILGTEVVFIDDCMGSKTKATLEHLKPGQVALLENLRFYEAEENPSINPNFAKTLASYGDVYIDDAFGTAHRAHSSTTAITEYFKDKAAMGFLLEKEVHFLESTIKNPKRPFYAIIGGSKIDTKMQVLQSLLSKVDAIFIGGGMAFTFFKALGISIGSSICDDSMLSIAKDFLQKASTQKVVCHLPLDIIAAKEIKENAPIEIIEISKGIPKELKGLDIGPKTIENWKNLLANGKTLFWNGPVGVFEVSTFAHGTNSIAKILAASKKSVTIVGGGDSVAAVNHLHLSDQMTHVSTGGGASLEFIEHGHLPGIDALTDK